MTQGRRKKLKRVYSATKAWVRAEFAFRLGPVAYETEPTNLYLKAEAKLRKVLTGSSRLARAGKRLGCKATDFEVARRKHLKKLVGADSVPKPKKDKPPQRKRLGLFD